MFKMKNVLIPCSTLVSLIVVQQQPGGVEFTTVFHMHISSQSLSNVFTQSTMKNAGLFCFIGWCFPFLFLWSFKFESWQPVVQSVSNATNRLLTSRSKNCTSPLLLKTTRTVVPKINTLNCQGDDQSDMRCPNMCTSGVLNRMAIEKLIFRKSTAGNSA